MPSTLSTENVAVSPPDDFDQALLEAFASALRPPDRRPVPEWARSKVKLPHSARSQAFNPDDGPWLNKPLEDFFDNANSQIGLCGPTGGGKTTFFEVALPRIIAEDPGPCQVTMQSDADASEWAETRAMPVFRDCEDVARLIPQDRHARRKTEIMFPHMPLWINGANLNNLQSKSLRWCLGDEVWRWKSGLIGEFKRRTHDRWNARVGLVSQGGTEGDEWHKFWIEGTQEIWCWCCSACSRVQPFQILQLKYDEVEGNPEATAATVRMRCVNDDCAAEFADTPQNRRKLADSGRYVVTNATPSPRCRSYRFNILTVYWVPWSKIALEWIEANRQKASGQTDALRQFIQKRLAEFWREENVDPAANLTTAGYSKALYAEGQLWEEEAFRFLTVDVQRNHFWAVARAWRRSGTSRLLWEGKLLTYEMINDLRERLKIRPQLTFIDAQHDTPIVYQRCARHGWTALHGSGQNGFTIHDAGKKPARRFFTNLAVANPPGCKYVFWSNTGVKDQLAMLRAGTEPAWEVPDDRSEDYASQIDAEVKRDVIVGKDKHVERRWVPRTGGRPNHLGDCEAMQTAAAMMMRIIGAEPVLSPSGDGARDVAGSNPAPATPVHDLAVNCVDTSNLT